MKGFPLGEGNTPIGGTSSKAAQAAPQASNQVTNQLRKPSHEGKEIASLPGPIHAEFS